METLGLIPARGGSKSIPYKNVASLAGLPMIAHVNEAAKRCRTIDRIVCSTEDQRIADVCRELDIEVAPRPPELAGDDSPVTAAITDILQRMENEGYKPDAVALLQVTSPFLLPEHIDRTVEALANDPDAMSAQTVSPIPHNFHAYNQREIGGSYVRFHFRDERERCYNKQTKPKFFRFGNLVVTRSKALLAGQSCFAEPSVPVEIPEPYALDVDGPEDLETAKWYLEAGKVVLPWLETGAQR